jgi:transcriptional regulator with XRE-family HTH domain
MDIRRVVGKNVRRYRKEAELSKEELAARIGVEQGYVSRLEAGKRNPTIVTIWDAAEALGVCPAALFRAHAQSSKATAKRKKIRKPIIQIWLLLPALLIGQVSRQPFIACLPVLGHSPPFAVGALST